MTMTWRVLLKRKGGAGFETVGDILQTEGVPDRGTRLPVIVDGKTVNAVVDFAGPAAAGMGPPNGILHMSEV